MKELNGMKIKTQCHFSFSWQLVTALVSPSWWRLPFVSHLILQQLMSEQILYGAFHVFDKECQTWNANSTNSWKKINQMCKCRASPASFIQLQDISSPLKRFPPSLYLCFCLITSFFFFLFFPFQKEINTDEMPLFSDLHWNAVCSLLVNGPVAGGSVQICLSFVFSHSPRHRQGCLSFLFEVSFYSELSTWDLTNIQMCTATGTISIGTVNIHGTWREV